VIKDWLSHDAPFEYEYRSAEYEYRSAEYEYRSAEYEYRSAEYEYEYEALMARTLSLN
jgi:hypothetical protein